MYERIYNTIDIGRSNSYMTIQSFLPDPCARSASRDARRTFSSSLNSCALIGLAGSRMITIDSPLSEHGLASLESGFPFPVSNV